jgi:xanthine dehydrogenase YagS FAD-binding subunit
MRSFAHVNAATVDEACSLLRRYKGKAVLSAGGTDLLSTLKGENLPEYPKAVINIKTIQGLNEITEKGGALQIGALARLSDIAGSPLVRRSCEVLAEAALSVATPQIRNAATIGGNLCQDTRCWYYRYPRRLGGPLHCLRKGKGRCLAVTGDNRYHAIIGGRKCFAVCPSDTAVALAALNACIRIAGANGERTIPVMEFFNPLGNALVWGEMVTSVEIPVIEAPARQAFLKFTLRKPVDFAVVSVASVIVEEQGACADARIVLGAVAPGPLRASEAEHILKGRPITAELASEAARIALADAKPLSMNAYKTEIARTLVKRALLGKQQDNTEGRWMTASLG